MTEARNQIGEGGGEAFWHRKAGMIESQAEGRGLESADNISAVVCLLPSRCMQILCVNVLFVGMLHNAFSLLAARDISAVDDKNRIGFLCTCAVQGLVCLLARSFACDMFVR